MKYFGAKLAFFYLITEYFAKIFTLFVYYPLSSLVTTPTSTVPPYAGRTKAKKRGVITTSRFPKTNYLKTNLLKQIKIYFFPFWVQN